MLYFGFAVSDSMFAGNIHVSRRELSPEEVEAMLRENEVSFCLNPSHKPTIDVAINRLGFEIEIPGKAPLVELDAGDSLIVMSVRGLPRLEGRHEYTIEEIENASFTFSIWNIPPQESLIEVIQTVLVKGQVVDLSGLTYSDAFVKVARACGFDVPELDLSFYPTRMINMETGETYFQHSSLGWIHDQNFFLIELMACEKGFIPCDICGEKKKLI